MSEIMETLFTALQFQSSTQQEAEARATQASKKALRTVQQKLTPEEFDALWNSITDIDSASNLDSFTQGFRLGVQLTLEGLRPVYPD